jgi:anti-sigma regulatory factor (Ser/Thr protein kinase)
MFDELINNVISYAYDDGAAHDIGVRVELTGDRLAITIVDDGVPFNPLVTSPPDPALPIEERKLGGLGIHLVRSTMDEFTYNRRTDSNVVVLVKYLEPTREA